MLSAPVAVCANESKTPAAGMSAGLTFCRANSFSTLSRFTLAICLPLHERGGGACSPGLLRGPSGVEERDADVLEDEVPHDPPRDLHKYQRAHHFEARGQQHDVDHGWTTRGRAGRMQAQRPAGFPASSDWR